LVDHREPVAGDRRPDARDHQIEVRDGRALVQQRLPAILHLQLAAKRVEDHGFVAEGFDRFAKPPRGVEVRLARKDGDPFAVGRRPAGRTHRPVAARLGRKGVAHGAPGRTAGNLPAALDAYQHRGGMGLPGRSKTGFGRLDPSEREEVPVPISDLPKIPMENPPDYKKTLNLPRTEFPMKANLPQREPERLSWWKDQRIYERLLEKNRNCPPFRFHDGPPYANGHIHQGHMLNLIIKSIVCNNLSMTVRYVD